MNQLLKHFIKFIAPCFVGVGLVVCDGSAVAQTPPIMVEELAQPAKSKPVEVGSQQAIKNRNTLTSFQTRPTHRNVSSLSFSWNIPVSLAVFERNGQLWIVFDHPQIINMEELRANAGLLADNIFQFPHPSATIIRMTPQEHVKTLIRKEGLLWIVDLFTGDVPNRTKDMNIFTQYDGLKRAYLFIPTNTAGNVVAALDPEVGDIITIAPTSDIALGVNNPYTYPEFDLLSSKQGLAFVVNTPDVMLHRGNTGLILKAPNRGLNITPDLEMLKRQQMFTQSGDSLLTFDLKVSPQLLIKDFNEAENLLKQDIIKAPKEDKNQAHLELAKYYIAKGLGTNALQILNMLQKNKAPEANSDKFYALLGVANFLAHRYDEAMRNFEHGQLPAINESIFWRTVASSAKEYKAENNVILSSYVSLIRDYPQELKDQIAIIGAGTAIRANDDISAQNFIDVLKTSTNTFKDRKPQLDYLIAKKLELQGYPRNAIKEYQRIGRYDDQKFSSLARYDSAILGEKFSTTSLTDAIGELEKLRYAWSEPVFKRELMKNLAKLYVKNHDYYNGLKTLQETLPLVDNKEKEQLTNLMTQWFEDVYANNQADDMSPIRSLALFQDFGRLAERSSQRVEITQKLADRLVSVDLLERAEQLLNGLLEDKSLSKVERAKLGARLALIYLFENRSPNALEALQATADSNLPEDLQALRRVVRAKTLADLGQIDEALELLQDDYSQNAILLKSEIYWNAQQWADASDSLKYLIEQPTPGKPLSVEQIGYILDWATALKKAGKETILVRLRHKFEPYFVNTKYDSAFNILTNPLEADKIELKAIKNAVNDVQAFSNFAKNYNESLKSLEIK